jgi:TolA-binding protein
VKIIEKFPTGSLVAAAYYRIGLTSMSLGNFEDAEIFFSEVKNNHKKSKWAKDAAKQLAMVRKKLAKR